MMGENERNKMPKSHISRVLNAVGDSHTREHWKLFIMSDGRMQHLYIT
jgi:hypothetical protein